MVAPRAAVIGVLKSAGAVGLTVKIADDVRPLLLITKVAEPAGVW